MRERVTMKLKRRISLADTVASVILLLWSIITLVVIVQVVLSSFRSYKDLALNGTWTIPEALTLVNHERLIIKDNFLRWMFNSIIISLTATVFNLYFASLAAYGLARFRFKCRRVLYLYFMLGLMFPSQLGMVPLFIMLRGIGLANSLLGIILIYGASFSLPIFIIYNFVKTVPSELNEAAKIDGAGEFTIFNRIILPLLSPVVASLLPLVLTSTWNDFFMPMIFLKDDIKKTIPIGIMKYVTGSGFRFSEINHVYAAAALSIAPIMIIYFLASRRIIAGLTSGAVKE
jgi:raffinose/stachyose/melibiose transport system permease protein